MKKSIRFSGNYNFTVVNTDTWTLVGVDSSRGIKYLTKEIKNNSGQKMRVMVSYGENRSPEFQLYECDKLFVSQKWTETQYKDIVFTRRDLWNEWLGVLDSWAGLRSML